MVRYELAQMNVARLRTPLNSPQLADFVNALDRVNMSVWRDPQSLQAFVYRSDHAGVMRRRREWFEKMDLYLVLWWVPRGLRPTTVEGIERLELLRSRGPSAGAFTFGSLFPAPARQPDFA